MTIIEQVHKQANQELYQKYPCLDMANLDKSPDGHWKLWEIEWIVNIYEEVKGGIQQGTQSNNKHAKSGRGKGVHKVPSK